MFTGGVAALRAAGRASRAICSKNFLQDKGSISNKGSISGKGSISDKESISYIISPKNRAGCRASEGFLQGAELAKGFRRGPS